MVEREKRDMRQFEEEDKEHLHLPLIVVHFKALCFS